MEGQDTDTKTPDKSNFTIEDIIPMEGQDTDKKTPDKSNFTMEDIIPVMGEFGRFQKMLLTFLFLSCLPASFQVLMVYFSTLVPSWKCVTNSTVCMFNGTLSPDDLSRCDMPREDWYYTEPKEFSFVTEFDLHCEDEWMLHLASSMVFIGWGVGAFFLGWLGDVYGRRSVFYPSISFVIVVGFCAAFVTNIYNVMVCQFIIGFFIPGTHLQAFILISELVGSKHRPLAGTLIYLANPIGWIILALKAYLIKDWKILSMVCTAPYLFIFVFYKFVPESIRWLHLYGKTNDVKEIVCRVAKWNNKNLPRDFDIKASYDGPMKAANPLDLCGTPSFALMTVIQGYLWATTATCYYGLHMAANDIGGSTYRDFIILNLVELPAIALAIFCCDYIGRKRATLVPLFLGTIICMGIAFIPKTPSSVKLFRTVLGVVGYFMTSIAFYAIYPWTVEIFPLHIRNAGMGYLQVVSHFGTASAPWIVKGLKRYGDWCAFFVLGGPAFVAALIALWLRETKETNKLEGVVIEHRATVAHKREEMRRASQDGTLTQKNGDTNGFPEIVIGEAGMRRRNTFTSELAFCDTIENKFVDITSMS